ncbi:MAG: IS1 family transposase [Chroococcidiopsidaceae cyanobacterium CP_BM_ER_R8_30]|nr:IS1 family transposase [Chroococcidiopsidaceae cyanobacterium CP_BM_ER_R8_30]
MNCPRCNSSKIRKFGHQDGKQRFKCNECSRIWRASFTQRGYPTEIKQLCIKMYLNGMGFRAIERVTEIHHTTIIDWVREAEVQLPEDEEAEPPEVAELDELQTFVGSKKKKVWLWTALNHYQPGILAITVGDRSGKTFSKLWERVENWGSKWYMTDGYCVYANFIDPAKHFVMKKTKMIRVEGENTRLRHYLARLHRATLCYSKSVEMLRCSVRLLMHYLRFKTIPFLSKATA